MTAVELRGARDASEVEQAYELAARTFGPSYFEARESKTHLRALEPMASTLDAVVAIHHGEVVGFVRIVDRAVWLGGRTLAVGGITSVAVRPDFRGKGIGRDIMEAALMRSRERGDALSIAFARRAVDRFYWRLGYIGLGSHVHMTVSPGPATEGRRCDVRSGLDQAPTELYRDAYAASYEGLPLSFNRSAQWWTTFAERMKLINPQEGHGLNTVFVGGAAVGYYAAYQGRVIEAAGIADSTGHVLDAVMAHGDAPEQALALPVAHWCMAACRHFNHELRVRQAWDGGHVVRVLDGGAFCDALEALHGDARQVAPLRELDVNDHKSSRRTLLRAAGVDPDAADRSANARPKPKALPSWNRLDEF